MYSDNFTNPAAGWQRGMLASGSGGIASYQRSGYAIQTYQLESAWSPAPYFSSALHAVAIDATATEQSGSADDEYGIGCAASGGSDSANYLFLLTASGYFQTLNAMARQRSVIVSGFSPLIAGLGHPNRLQAQCVPAVRSDGTHVTQLSLTVNGHNLVSIADAAFGTAKAWTGGLATETPAQTGSIVDFRSFSLTDLRSPLRLAPVPPGRQVYAVDFAQPSGGWSPPSNQPASSAGFSGGGLTLRTSSVEYVDSPYFSSHMTAIELSATTTSLQGSVTNSYGVYCDDGTVAGAPQFFFAVDGTNHWIIAAVDTSSHNIHILRVGPAPAALSPGQPVTVAGSCVPRSSANGTYTTHLTLSINGAGVASLDTDTAGAPHPWGGGVIVVSAGAPGSATFSRFAMIQLNSDPS